jgi:hypothetical protein
MNNSIDAQVTDILRAVLSQDAESSGFPNALLNANANIVDVEQRTSTSLMQMTDSSCLSSTSNLSANNFTYLSNSTVGGNVEFTQQGDATANCTMTNISAAKVTNDLGASVSQTAKSLGLFGAIGGIIIIIIVIVVIIFIVMRSKSTPTPKPPPPPPKGANVTPTGKAATAASKVASSVQ